MNTVIHMSINSTEQKILDEAFIFLEKLEKMLSLYDKDSEISKINSFSGIQPVKVSPETIEIISEAKKFYEITKIFNPLIGPLTKLWKINQQSNEIPNTASLDEALKLIDINNLEINSDSIYLKKSGAILDLSGIVKGYASQKIAELFKYNNIKSALIDLGGNIYVVGKNRNNIEWNIGIRNPVEPNGIPAIVLKVQDTAVITSGNYERFKIINNKKYSHFFDPSTGKAIESDENDILSASLITPDGSMADALATAFMIAGYEKSLEIIKKIDSETGVVFIRDIKNKNNKNIEIFASKNLKNKIIKSYLPISFFE